MIEELIDRVFWTRNLTHAAHWNTDSYAQHMALGSFYDGVIGQIDKIVEAYQGRFGKVKPFMGIHEAPASILKHLEEEVKWIEKNRKSIAENITAIENLIDGLSEIYLTTVYKIRELN